MLQTEIHPDAMGGAGERVPQSVPSPVVSVVMPCLNEAMTVGECVRQAVTALTAMGVAGEVVVCDNGSTDDSPQIAADAGARVVHCQDRGYGHSVRTAMLHARGEYLVLADTDGSHDLGSLRDFVQKLREGADLVVGNRFQGGIDPGAMPWMNRWIGNPGLTWLINRVCALGIGDSQCGMRGITRSALQRMSLSCSGMELATEMLIQAARRGLRVVEIPTRMFKDGRNRAPHLLPIRDGLRHLKFLAASSPWRVVILPASSVMILAAFVLLLCLAAYPMAAAALAVLIILLLVLDGRLLSGPHCGPQV